MNKRRSPDLSGLWYGHSPVRWLLWPLSYLYRALAAWRRNAYLRGRKTRYRPPVPVIVVGNISVGGAGKTPLVIALVELLQQQGWSPGVISRGYKAQDLSQARQVTADSSATQVGDEPLLIFQRTAVPVYVLANRQRAIEALLQNHAVDILVCDDGLQHYALQRDIEIAVVDATRLHGNGLCLPAGPLREPPARLDSVDYVVYNGERSGEYFYTSDCRYLIPLAADVPAAGQLAADARPIRELQGRQVHAIAGIAHPQRFFDLLRRHHLRVIGHVFADHHDYQASDLQFDDNDPVIMTEKDAVKCRALDIDLSPCWYSLLETRLSADFQRALLQQLTQLRSSPGTTG